MSTIKVNDGRDESTLQSRLAQCETNLCTVAYACLVQEGCQTQEPASRLFRPVALD